MKTAIVLHGRNCTPEMFWYQYIADELRKLGYETSVPLLPESESADRTVWLPFIEQHFIASNESILIGVSSSCAAILEYVESLDHIVHKVILVAGFVSPLLNKDTHPILKDDYNWNKISENIEELYIINSDTDPTGADQQKGIEIFEKLGGHLIIIKDQGHFGSIKYDQPYKEFPLLKKLIQD